MSSNAEKQAAWRQRKRSYDSSVLYLARVYRDAYFVAMAYIYWSI